MLSEIPVNLQMVKKKNLDKEIMRAAMIAELDAVNLYESMAALTDSKDLAAILLDVAREEKVHVDVSDSAHGSGQGVPEDHGGLCSWKREIISRFRIHHLNDSSSVFRRTGLHPYVSHPRLHTML